MIKKLLLTLAAGMIIISCDDNIITECPDENQTGQEATFQFIQKEVFDKNCISCHAGVEPPEGMQLTNDLSYQNLVNVKSNQEDMLRVKPFDAQNSWIIKKLKGEGTTEMPPGRKLPDSVIDSVAAWINRGALNN